MVAVTDSFFGRPPGLPDWLLFAHVTPPRCEVTERGNRSPSPLRTR
jgi:hypothetical protein